MPTASPSRSLFEARMRALEGSSPVHGLQKLPAVFTDEAAAIRFIVAISD